MASGCSPVLSHAPPPPSALTELIPPGASPTEALTTQVLHNLQHQHLWTSLRTYAPYTLSPTQSAPLICGRPPNRVYTHPDEQAYMLEHGIREEDVHAAREREWVLPTAQGQSWTLQKMAGVFDALPWRDEGFDAVDGPDGDQERRRDQEQAQERQAELDTSRPLPSLEVLQQYQEERVAQKANWGGKRVLLSMVDRRMGGEGTVVYYIILEGTVKPRQN